MKQNRWVRSIQHLLTFGGKVYELIPSRWSPEVAERKNGLPLVSLDHDAAPHFSPDPGYSGWRCPGSNGTSSANLLLRIRHSGCYFQSRLEAPFDNGNPAPAVAVSFKGPASRVFSILITNSRFCHEGDSFGCYAFLIIAAS
jgi:hypothetical protein